MSTLDHAIWWHVYPLGACGAPVRPGADLPRDHVSHRLGRLEKWLDYVIELGCSGLLLGPLFASSTHGYDTVDYFRIDPRLGDHADWEHFVAEAHERGLLLMLDGVFNHVGVHHPLVAEGLKGAGIVRVSDELPCGWEGHADLAELDHADPRVADLVTAVMSHWLERGADGWRLDVAYAVPAAFWAEVLGRVRSRHPKAVFLGEVIHGDYPAVAAAGTLDAITAYEVWKAVWSSIKDRNLWELAWALERHDHFCATTRMQTFVGNHDVSRIASQVGDGGAALAVIILLTLPGVPSIYYGDEQAFRGDKGSGAGADDPLRPPLPDSPADLDPAGWWLYRLHQELIALRRRNPWITRGRTEVLDKTNTTCAYSVTGEEHRLTVHLGLEPVPGAAITIDGQPALAWPR